jgi:hypothetical protein
MKDAEETNLGSQMFGVASHFTKRFGYRAEFGIYPRITRISDLNSDVPGRAK